MSLTYSSYLKIDELLECQQPRSEGPEHDEMLFIVIHQVYELWFKCLLHELEFLRTSFDTENVPQAYGTLKRVLTILKTLVGQIDILETMTPLSFRSFRARLESASGFQSRQFRELEIILGRRDSAASEIHADNDASLRLLKRRVNEPSVWDSFVRFLSKSHSVPPSIVNRDASTQSAESEEVQAALVDAYRSNPEIAQLAERLVDLDEGMQEWRYRHVKMVERTIGTMPGTGGSAGAEYLRTTLFKPLFPDLWAIRARF